MSSRVPSCTLIPYYNQLILIPDSYHLSCKTTIQTCNRTIIKSILLLDVLEV